MNRYTILGLVTVAILLTCLFPTFAYATIPRCVSLNGLPDSTCTPGAKDPQVTQSNIKDTICKSGYTKTVRPPLSVTEKIKKQVMKNYGYTDSPKNYELDHLIPLEIGGAPRDVKNLWPEPSSIKLNFHEKDKFENYLHAQVCSGKMNLFTAQNQIATNWVKYWNSTRK